MTPPDSGEREVLSVNAAGTEAPTISASCTRCGHAWHGHAWATGPMRCAQIDCGCVVLQSIRRVPWMPRDPQTAQVSLPLPLAQRILAALESMSTVTDPLGDEWTDPEWAGLRDELRAIVERKT